MRVEELEGDGELVVRAELPGIDPDNDVEITVADRTLHIRAERRERSEEKEKGRYRSEFRYGSFERTLRLPPGASDKDVSATYSDGILEVRVPVDKGRAEAQKVPVIRS